VKMCVNCNRINPDDVEECIECGGKEFENISFPLEVDDAE